MLFLRKSGRKNRFPTFPEFLKQSLKQPIVAIVTRARAEVLTVAQHESPGLQKDHSWATITTASRSNICDAANQYLACGKARRSTSSAP